MTAQTTTAGAASATRATTPKKKPRRTKMLADGMDVERVPAESRRQAAVVLEVLAGLRTPEEAAEALGISSPTFYNLETRALRGLVHGCTPEPPGRKMALEKQLREAQKEKRSLEQQLQRYRALLRTTQRAGEMLVESTSKASKGPRAVNGSTRKKAGPGKTRKARKPRVRALRAIEALAVPPDPTPTPASTNAMTAPPAERSP